MCSDLLALKRYNMNKMADSSWLACNVSNVTKLVKKVRRLALRDRQTHTCRTVDKYCNPRSACAPRVNSCATA